MKQILYGVVLAFLAVVISGFLTPMVTGLSYQHFTWTVYAGPVYPSMETGLIGAGACSDGLDNDNDSFIDCADSDCFAVPPCFRPAPVASSAGVLVLTIAIATAGLLSLRLGRRRS